MSCCASQALSNIDDDTLITIFSFLSVYSILAMRQTCRRMMSISYTRIVWHNAYRHEVLGAGFPFPRSRLLSMDASELEHSVRRAHRIGQFWRSPTEIPRKLIDFTTSVAAEVTSVRFLPGWQGTRVVTVTKGIWPKITCWEVAACVMPPQARKIAEWSPKGMIFTGFVVNSDVASQGMIAASLIDEGRQCIEVLSIHEPEGGEPVLQSIRTIDPPLKPPLKPITLEGNLIAYSDASSKTVIMDWRSGACALLHSSEEPIDQHFQYNKCLQVVFAHKSVLIVRARSIELFSMPALRLSSESPPTYHPIAQHSFGWIDGVSVSIQAHDSDSCAIKPLSILLRAESDDPWSSDIHRLDLYILEPNPLYVDNAQLASPETSHDTEPPWHPHNSIVNSPYLFPPVHSKLFSPSVRGILRCTDIILGPCGTAIWIQPRPARSADLTSLDVHASETQAPETSRAKETVAAAVFAGPLQREYAEMNLGARNLWIQSFGSSSWTSIDYDEELGRIALGTSQGTVTMLDLG